MQKKKNYGIMRIACITVWLHTGQIPSFPVLPDEQTRVAQSMQNILCPQGTNAAVTSLSPHTKHSRRHKAAAAATAFAANILTVVLLPVLPLPPTPLPFPPTPFEEEFDEPLVPPNNESVGLTEVDGEQREPNALVTGRVQIFGDSPSPSSTSMESPKLFHMLISSGWLRAALFEEVDDELDEQDLLPPVEEDSTGAYCCGWWWGTVWWCSKLGLCWWIELGCCRG